MAKLQWPYCQPASTISSQVQLWPVCHRQAMSNQGQPGLAWTCQQYQMKTSHGQPCPVMDNQVQPNSYEHHFLLCSAMAVSFFSYGQPCPPIGSQVQAWAARSSKVQQGQPWAGRSSRGQQCSAKSSHGQSAMATHPSRSCNIQPCPVMAID